MTALLAKIIIGNIIHCRQPFKLEIIENGFIIVDSKTGKILAIGGNTSTDELKTVETRLNIQREVVITLTDSQLLVPGLIDTHIHAPQYPNAGLGYDKTLLDWLNEYTYKLEKKYSDNDLSKRVYDAVVGKTLSCGTTTACYFGSLFKHSSLILTDSIITQGQRAFVGKINMICLAPDDYIETAEESIRDTLDFIKTVKSRNNELVQPIITPRFALSVDMKLMKQLGEIAKNENLHIQTHISENTDEVQLVKDVFKMTYANVYNEANLLTPKTVLAHGIYLTDEELNLLKQKGTSISHCPDSNNNLKSGLCDVRRLIKHEINVGLGTDVAGGGSPSVITAMKSALDVSIHLSFNTKNYQPLEYSDVFYLATLGGAKALALDDKVGNFVVGKEFDALVVDSNVKQCSVDYLLKCNPTELLQKFIYSGDDRNVVKVFVAGKVVKDIL